MQFTVKKTDLLRELQLVQGVVEKKATIPILSNLLLRATRQGLEIVATDMELGIQSACDADVETEGAVTIHARRLHDIVRALPDSEIRFTLQKANRVQIKCANAEFKVAGQGIEDFPTLKEYDFKGAIAVPLDFFRSLIARVIFAITQDDPRYAIYGALLVVRKGSMEMVATDGHRLAYIKREADVAPREEMRVIVPSKTLAEIVKLEPGPEGEIRIGVKENNIFFKSGLRILQSSLFEGTFPNYEKVMPVGNDKLLTCEADALLSALRRVSLLSAERTKSVKMSIKDGKMLVSTSNPEFGEAEETIDLDGYKGGAMEIGFNSRYLIDFLQAVGTEQVQLELKDGETQGLLRPAGADGMDYRYVIMPMRI
jgi:DNA polymerase-3 subunit beta